MNVGTDIYTTAGYDAAHRTSGQAGETAQSENGDKAVRAADAFQKLIDQMIADHKLTPDNIRLEKDWREMDDEQWDKLIGHIDKYIEENREELEQMEEEQREAAMKAMAEAPADMRTLAAASAMLKVMANGTAGAQGDGDASRPDKLSWTYNIQTDDQTVLATAKMANEYAADVMSKSQEFILTGDTSAGISETKDLTECASLQEHEEEEKEKVWTVTAFSADGIICTECPEGGTPRQLWRIEYQDPQDAKRVWDFLAGFKKDADLKFAGSRQFWEDFLAGNVNMEEVVRAYQESSE